MLNLILAGVVVVIMIYSLAFRPESDSYPLPCIHEKVTGEPCPSCGLSHAFSLMVRGRVKEAAGWNSHAPVVFGYFVVQLLMRLLFTVMALRVKRDLRALAVADTIISAVMTLMVFYPFLRLLWLSLK